MTRYLRATIDVTFSKTSVGSCDACTKMTEFEMVRRKQTAKFVTIRQVSSDQEI